MIAGARRARSAVVIATLGVATALLVPTLAAACTVCFGGEESDWSTAFTLGTILIIGLPPGIIATAVFVIYRASKRRQAFLDAQEAESRVRQHRAPSPQPIR